MNAYPTISTSDTGALSDIPRNLYAKIEQQPVISGAIIGGLIGHFFFKKKSLIGAIVGAALGTVPIGK